MLNNAQYAATILHKYGNVLSSEEFKEICDSTDPIEVAKCTVLYGAPSNNREAQIMALAAGEMDSDHNFDKDGDLWTDDVLNKYADHVYNYLYQYNDEALKVDPSIDTEKEHIGPMAQDLEKVNPAVVQEDPKSGYKTVDTGRLALMNAGAIADLARELKELKHGL